MLNTFENTYIISSTSVDGFPQIYGATTGVVSPSDQTYESIIQKKEGTKRRIKKLCSITDDTTLKY